MARSSSAVQVQQKLPAGARTPAKSSLTSETERLKILIDVLASEATTDERHGYFAQMACRMSPTSLKRVVESLTPLCKESASPKLQPAHKEAQKLREIFERELNQLKAQVPRTPKESRAETVKPTVETPVAQKVVNISSATKAPQKPAPTPAPVPLTGKAEVEQAKKKMKALGPAGKPTRYSTTSKDDCDLTTMMAPADVKVVKPPWPGTWSPSAEQEVGGKSGVKRHVAHGKYGAD